MISPSTICYALKMTHDFLKSEYSCNKTEYNRKWLEELSDAVDEIDSLKFEVEGFERVQWVKFNPKDPKTFPPKCDFLGYFDHGGINDFQYVCIRDDEDTDEAIATQAIFPRLKYWRPLPQPPVETETKHD